MESVVVVFFSSNRMPPV